MLISCNWKDMSAIPRECFMLNVQENGAVVSGADKAEQSAAVEGPSETQQAEAAPQQEDTVMADQEPPATANNESVGQAETQDMQTTDGGENQPMDAESCESAAAAAETVDAPIEEQQVEQPDDQVAKEETVVQDTQEQKEAALVEQAPPAAAAAQSSTTSAATAKSKKRQTMEINKENTSERNGRKSSAAWRKSGVEPVSSFSCMYHAYIHVSVCVCVCVCFCIQFSCIYANTCTPIFSARSRIVHHCGSISAQTRSSPRASWRWRGSSSMSRRSNRSRKAPLLRQQMLRCAWAGTSFSSSI
jgi:hypothetical protein